MIFDVPVARAEISLINHPKSPFITTENPIYSWQWGRSSVSVTLPTKPVIDEVIETGVGDKVWIYSRVNTKVNAGNGNVTWTQGPWQIEDGDGSDWGTEVSQTIADSETIGACNQDPLELNCWGKLNNFYNVMIRVERDNQSYWFDIF